MNIHDIVLWAALIVCTLLLVACGNEALRLNTAIATGMLEVQSASGPVVRQLRSQAAVSAARRVHDVGGTEVEAQAAAETEADSWQCALEGHRIYALAVGTYIDTISLWSNGRDFALLDAFPFVQRALDSYRFFASCLASLGSDVLPEVPEFFNLIPSTWNMGSTSP